jgi:phosphoacetylglucosamine mutase
MHALCTCLRLTPSSLQVGMNRGALVWLQIVNPAIGDSMTGLLLVAAILKRTRVSPQAWAALYTPISCRLAALRVADRHAIATECLETRVASPAALQSEIDTLVAATPLGRAFVRPSGTEDVVRVYAEAADEAACAKLTFAVMCAVHRHAGGLGDVTSSLT